MRVEGGVVLQGGGRRGKGLLERGVGNLILHQILGEKVDWS